MRAPVEPGSRNHADPLRHHGDVEVRGAGCSTSRSTSTPAPGRSGWSRRSATASRRSGAYPSADCRGGGRSPSGTGEHARRCSRPPVPPRRSPCWPGPGRGAGRWWCTRSSPSRTRRSSRPDTPSPRSCCRTPFTLDPALVPDDADLVVVGNPTNPTGVLHPADLLRSLQRPGRLVVVDEAFMDTVPGEAETLAGDRGVLVIRSLTKHWSIPGVRAGYVARPRGRGRGPAPRAVAVVGLVDRRSGHPRVHQHGGRAPSRTDAHGRSPSGARRSPRA